MALSRIEALIERLADDVGLEIDEIDTFGADYARTLAEWRERFRSAWPTLGFDDRFRRLWELYLGYCEVGFTLGRIDVGQWVFRRRPAG